MDIYLVYFPEGLHFLVDPTDQQMASSVIITRRLNVPRGCEDRVKFEMLDSAAIYLFNRSLEKMLPERPDFFCEMFDAFTSQVPVAFQISWKILRLLGEEALTDGYSNHPDVS